ncbi:beta-defensin 43-like [Perognathus longimembris pacificus]|uniref:beta-defensin 43-like n=1 Tax=Perognathus longimembris pacificus TaxID=214514 RepID=UPI002018D5C0|nr:beta-defensin 43-like [Perognathus longimembris pacificus]
MRVLFSFLGLLAFFSMIPPARSFLFKAGCSTRYYSCRMKCNAYEYSVRYFDDWSICCKTKKSEIKKRKGQLCSLRIPGK